MNLETVHWHNYYSNHLNHNHLNAQLFIAAPKLVQEISVMLPACVNFNFCI